MTNPVMWTTVERNYGDKTILARGHWVWCPGCDQAHRFRSAHPEGVNEQPLWAWDGSETAPTFEPSLLVHLDDAHTCHSFLRQGEWEFLSDSTAHELRDRHPMVPLPDWLVRQ